MIHLNLKAATAAFFSDLGSPHRVNPNDPEIVCVWYEKGAYHIVAKWEVENGMRSQRTLHRLTPRQWSYFHWTVKDYPLSIEGGYLFSTTDEHVLPIWWEPEMGFEVGLIESDGPENEPHGYNIHTTNCNWPKGKVVRSSIGMPAFYTTLPFRKYYIQDNQWLTAGYWWKDRDKLINQVIFTEFNLTHRTQPETWDTELKAMDLGFEVLGVCVSDDRLTACGHGQYDLAIFDLD